MKLRLIHFLSILLILLAAAQCVPIHKPSSNTAVAKPIEAKTCPKITTQDECLSSTCLWCNDKCVDYKTLNLILGKSSNCPSGDATFKYTWLKVWYFQILFWVFIVLLVALLAVGAKMLARILPLLKV